jgi:branched-chain amino acid transport system permease protein
MSARSTSVSSIARSWWPLVILCILVVGIPPLGAGRNIALDAVLTLALINIAMVVALYVFVGNSGVVSFGQASFMAVGAYICGMLTIPQIAKPVVIPNAPGILLDHTLGTMPAILVGGAIAGAAAALVSIPLLRLKGIAASIGTLSLLVITSTFFTNWKPGSSGGGNLTRMPTDTTINSATLWVVIFLVVAFVYQRSRFGLRLRASREDEVAARAVGIRVNLERRIAFVLSGAMFGIVGGLYAHTIGSISANDFSFDITFIGLAMLVVGGTRSLFGAVLGASIISILDYAFDQWQNGSSAFGVTLDVPNGTSDLLIALVLVLVLIFRPNGLSGGQEVPWPRLPSRGKPENGGAGPSSDKAPLGTDASSGEPTRTNA